MKKTRSARPKVCLIINTFNEGPEVKRTVDSFRKNKGATDFSAVIVFDGTTDGSFKPFINTKSVLAIVNKKQVGCGQSKAIAVGAAMKQFKPDVIIHSDGHNRLVRGTLRDIADAALAEETIVTPALGPLHCGKDQTCKNHAKKGICVATCPKKIDNQDLPTNCYIGGGFSITKEDKDTGHIKDVMLHADGLVSNPPADVFKTNVVNPSCFAYSIKTLKAIGGWNVFPGWWGSQELGVSLRAWFAAVPITCFSADKVCVLHLYRSWNHPKGSAIAPYDIPDSHSKANQRYALAVVFDPKTYAGVWEQWFKRFDRNAEAEKMFQASDWKAQAAAFRKLKRRTDREFFSDAIGVQFPLDIKVKEGAKGVLYAAAAGVGNVMMALPAIKALATMSGRAVTVLDDGLHAKGQIVPLLERQSYIDRVIGKSELKHLDEYEYIVGSYWANGPAFLPIGAKAAEADHGCWRTRHEVEANMDAVRRVGFEGPTPVPDVEAFAVPEGIPYRAKDYVAIGVECAGFHSKRYSRWREACEILNKRGVKMVFLGTKKASEPWMDRLGTNYCGKLELATSAGVLAWSRLYIGIDNGLSHLAAALHVPMVLLYGPSSERKNRPWSTACTVLRAGGFACTQCWDHPRAGKCDNEPEDNRPCMRSIRPEYVARRVLGLMDSPAWAVSDPYSLYLTKKQKMVNMGAEPIQNHFELAALVGQIRHEDIVNVCEIGLGRGGWLGTMVECLGLPLNILAIDPNPSDWHDGAQVKHKIPKDYPIQWPAVEKHLREIGTNLKFIKAKSASAGAQKKARAWTKEHGPFDLLHIDGDHAEKAGQIDFDIYSKMVRPGGLIIFHDVTNPKEPGSWRVFNRVKKTGWEWVVLGANKGSRSGGIAILRNMQ